MEGDNTTSQKDRVRESKHVSRHQHGYNEKTLTNAPKHYGIRSRDRPRTSKGRPISQATDVDAIANRMSMQNGLKRPGSKTSTVSKDDVVNFCTASVNCSQGLRTSGDKMANCKSGAIKVSSLVDKFNRGNVVNNEVDNKSDVRKDDILSSAVDGAGESVVDVGDAVSVTGDNDNVLNVDEKCDDEKSIDRHFYDNISHGDGDSKGNDNVDFTGDNDEKNFDIVYISTSGEQSSKTDNDICRGDENTYSEESYTKAGFAGDTTPDFSKRQFGNKGREIQEMIIPRLKCYHSDIIALSCIVRDVLKQYSADLDIVPMSEFINDIDKFQADIDSLHNFMLMYKDFTLEVNETLKELRQATRDVNDRINERIKNDLVNWATAGTQKLDNALFEETKAIEAALQSRIAESTVILTEVGAKVTELERLAAEVEAEAARAALVSHQAAEEAIRSRDNAEKVRLAEKERKKVEEEARLEAAEHTRLRQEEERRAREEQERRLAEEAEAQHLSIDELRRREAEEHAKQEAHRRDPENWPRYIYSIDGREFDSGIGCVIRAIPGSLARDELLVSGENITEMNLPLEDNQEVVSNVITVKLADEKKVLALEEPLCLTIPHCAPRLNPAREAVISMQQPNGKWLQIPTKDVSFDDIRELRFVEARVHCVGTFVVTLRLRRDHLTLTSRGGRVNSTVDSRVTFTAEPKLFRASVTFALEIQPIEQHTVHELKHHQSPECDSLMASSPILRWSIAYRKFSKPITVTVPVSPNPTIRSKRPGTAVASDRKEPGLAKRPSTAKLSLNTHNNDELMIEDELVLLKQEGSSDWSVVKDVELTQNKKMDMAIFDTREPYERFVVFRVRQGTPSVRVEKMVRILENSLKDREVQFVLRQRSDDLSSTCLACVRSHKAEKHIKKLSAAGYDSGPSISRNVIMKEGQVIEIRFRGNIAVHGSEDGPAVSKSHKISFNSHLNCRLNFPVAEVDRFAQKSFDSFRGFAQVYTRGLVRRDVILEDDGTGRSALTQRVQTMWEEGDVLLCEFLVSLPKPTVEPPKPLVTAPVMIRPEGPVDDDIYRLIANEMVEDWKKLAQYLNVRRMRIQAILRQNVNKEPRQCVYDMLITWAKQVPRCLKKTDMLCSALLACGRADLVEELRERERDFQKERSLANKESYLRRAFIKISQNLAVASQWRTLAAQLGLSESDIQETDDSALSNHDRCLNALVQWRHVTGDAASVRLLARYLRVCRFRTMAREVAQIC